MPLTQVQGQMLGGSNNTTTTIQSNGSTAVTIDSSQNVGIGTSSPSAKLHVDGTGNQYSRLSSSTHSNFIQAGCVSGSTFHEYKSVYRLVDTDAGERMRIDSSGNLLVGTTSSAVTTAGILLKPAGNSASVPLVGSTGASSSSGEITMAVYSTTAAQYQFYVAYNGQATGRFTYATFSDARLKTNISSIQNGLATITALNPVTFNFLPAKDQTENSDLKYGFIAQEVQQLLPTLVNEGLDKAEDGTPYLTLQTGDLLPIAIKAIQELKAELDEAKAEIAALKEAK
jgi:hypothetical protein